MKSRITSVGSPNYLRTPAPRRTSLLNLFVLLLPCSTRLSMITMVRGETYGLVKEYAGQTFFDDWEFYDHYDNLTNGNVQFISSSQATSSKLAYVHPETNHAIIAVDNTTSLTFSERRNSVRIQTKERFGVGSVWVADVVRVPFGCSVWPAWWSHAPDWPTGGEIDTFESINLAPLSHMGLHTLPGCTTPSQLQFSRPQPLPISSSSPSQSSQQSSSSLTPSSSLIPRQQPPQTPLQSSPLINSTDCSHLSNQNQGCITTNPNPLANGEAFAKNGGGVWVTQFAEAGVGVWFFERGKIPEVLARNESRVEVDSLGTPVAYWSSRDCESGRFFEPQHLLFTITLCGDYAGRPEIFTQTCSGICYDDYVLGDPSYYANAYFEVKSVRVFSKLGTNTVVLGSGAVGAYRGILGSGGLGVSVVGIGVGLVGLLVGW